MTQAIAVQTPDFKQIERVLIGGDLSRLKEDERVSYYYKVCETVGLNPLTRPFDYIQLGGKLVLYANKGCGEQLRQIRKISIRIASRETIEGVYVVTAEAADPAGRVDASTGAVTIASLKGDALANAMMKAETKAKRRVTLSVCGLNMLDESELDSLPRVVPQQPMAEDGVQGETSGEGISDEDYRVPGGTYAKRGFREIDGKELLAFITRREEFIKVKPEKKPLWWDEFVTRAERYYAEQESRELEPGWEG